MEDEKISPVGELLFEYHIQYQQKKKRAVTQKEFAKYIGIEDTLYNHIYRGRRKIGKNTVRQLAEFFHDLRFYDAAGEPRPDPILFYVQSNWENLPNVARKQISEVLRKYVDRDDGE